MRVTYTLCEGKSVYSVGCIVYGKQVGGRTKRTENTICTILGMENLQVPEKSSTFASGNKIFFIMETGNTPHYDPYASIAFVEVLLNVSYGTARRRMAVAKEAYGLSGRDRLRESQVRSFFC